MSNYFLQILTVFLLITSLVSCDSDDTSTEMQTSVDRELLDRTQKQLLDLEQSMALQQVFTNHPHADAGLIRATVNKSRSAVVILSRLNLDSAPVKQLELAYNELNAASYLLEEIRLLEGESEEVDDVFNNLRLIRHKLAQDLGKPVQNWTLYKYNFGLGIEPEFMAPEGKDRFGAPKWATNFQIDLPKAKVQAREGYAWMVSRSFDLSQVENPAFRFHAAYLVTSRDSKLTLFEVVNTVFKTYVLLDVQPGEVIEEIPDERKIRVFYSPDEIPKARDFHDRWVPFRSLERYKNHKVSIGFLFDTRDIKETQFYIWDLYDFELTGAGELGIEPYSYIPSRLGGYGEFNSLTSQFAGVEWVATGTDSIEVTSEGDTEVALLSPAFYTQRMPFQNHNLQLIVDETVTSIPLAEQPIDTEILISTRYLPGQPFDRYTQGWTPLKRDSISSTTENAMNTGLLPQSSEDKTLSSKFDLSAYTGEEFTLALYFKSQASNNTWAINDFRLLGDGLRIYALPFKARDANSIEQVAVFNSFDLRSVVSKKIDIQTGQGTTRSVFVLSAEPDVIAQIPDPREDNSADIPTWRPSRDNDGLRASGYKKEGNRTSPSQLVLKEQQLNPEINLVRIKHRIGFMKEAGELSVSLRISGTRDWHEINFANELSVETNRRFTTTQWVPIPGRFAGQDIDIAFRYQATEAQAPEWIIQTIEFATEGAE